MQALGSYKGGKKLFLGLGTGLGTTMIVKGVVAPPMEVSHLPYKRATCGGLRLCEKHSVVPPDLPPAGARRIRKN